MNTETKTLAREDLERSKGCEVRIETCSDQGDTSMSCRTKQVESEVSPTAQESAITYTVRVGRLAALWGKRRQSAFVTVQARTLDEAEATALEVAEDDDGELEWEEDWRDMDSDVYDMWVDNDSHDELEES